MTHKKNDKGLEHVKRLKLRQFKNPFEMTKEFGKIYGRNREKEIADLCNSFNQPDFYLRKDADYDLAMFFSGAYDFNHIQVVCNWIYENRTYFGDTILEIGCDCGFITTFLGGLLPEKKILSIDRNPTAIKVAKKNCEKFGITNVDFECCDVKDICGRSFDTVLSIRTMHQNYDYDEDTFQELVPYAAKFTEQLDCYAEILSKLLKKSGNLISIERADRNALMLGWITAISDSNLKPDYKGMLKYKVMGEINVLSAFVAEITNEKIDPMGIFFDICRKEMNIHGSNYKDWDAKIMFEFTKGEKIIDYYIDNRKGVRSHMAIYWHIDDETCILIYQNHNGNTTLGYVDVSLKEKMTAELTDVIKTAIESDYIVEEL